MRNTYMTSMIIIIMLFRSFFVLAEDKPPQVCHTDEYFKVHDINGELTAARLAGEERLQHWIQTMKQKGNSLQTQTTYVIPVVVHVVYKNANENIPDAQIISNINSLNEDYRKMNGTSGYNTKSVGADLKIEFRLATTAPNGQPTNGITRTSTTKTKFDPYTDEVMYLSLGGVDPWDVNNYLNVWVADIFDWANATSTFPSAYPPDRQGVVVDFTRFGDNINTVPPLHLGRLLTHEVGHYLNLFHTFEGKSCDNSDCGNQGDRCCDTPPTKSETTGCPGYTETCVNATTQTENYMDYANDACKNLFTVDQSTRARATLASIRTQLHDPNMSTEFRVFGNHVGIYSYNETTDIVALGMNQYDDMIIPSTNTVDMRSKTGVVFRDGFEARAGSTMRAWIDGSIPSFNKPAFLDDDSATDYSLFDYYSITVVPNPAFDQITIHGDISGLTEVYSSIGSNVAYAESGVRSIDISQLAQGSYYVRCTTPQGIVVKPFVIVR